MIRKQITICNKLGLHARAAAKLIALTSTFGSAIELHKDGKSVDAKSIMSVMLLAASQGTVIEISADGNDEEHAISAIEELINNRFDEEE